MAFRRESSRRSLTPYLSTARLSDDLFSSSCAGQKSHCANQNQNRAWVPLALVVMQRRKFDSPMMRGQ